MVLLRRLLALALAVALLAVPAWAAAGGNDGIEVRLRADGLTDSSDDVNNIRYVTVAGQVEIKGGPVDITGATMWVTYFEDVTHLPQDSDPVTLAIAGTVGSSLKTRFSADFVLPNASGGRGYIIHLKVTTAGGQTVEATVNASR